MCGNLNPQGLLLISSKKLLLAESDKAVFSLILPSPALGELSEHTYLWEFIWWSLQLAFIISNTSQIVGWCLDKWSDSIFWNLSLLGENVPRFLLVVWFFFPISELACSVQKTKEKQSRSVALDCSMLPFSFHQDLRSCALGCWVLSVSDKPRSQPTAGGS